MINMGEGWKLRFRKQSNVLGLGDFILKGENELLIKTAPNTMAETVVKCFIQHQILAKHGFVDTRQYDWVSTTNMVLDVLQRAN